MYENEGLEISNVHVGDITLSRKLQELTIIKLHIDIKITT